MQYGYQCFCDDYYPAVETLPSECNMSCDGNEYQRCGGFWRMNVYSTTYPHPRISRAEVKELMASDDSDDRKRREVEEWTFTKEQKDESEK